MNGIEKIKQIDRPYLLATDVAPILCLEAHKIRLQAHADPAKLGFPVTVCGTRVRIPKEGFLRYMRGETYANT